MGNPHALRKNTYVKSAKPRPQSVVSCDPPCRNPIEGRSEDSVLAAINENSADENVNISQAVVKVREAEVAGSACSEGSKSNVLPAQ
jgi:hypothetical protein